MLDVQSGPRADRRFRGMSPTHPRARSAACWTKTGLPWLVVLAISTGLALALTAAGARAVPGQRPSDAVSNDAQEVINLCALHVDRGALYAYVAAPEARTFYDRVCTSI